MINYFTALSFLFNSVNKSIYFNRFNNKILNESLGLTSYLDVSSFRNIPYFFNSAMDGYAFNFKILKYNFINANNRLFIIDIIKAGDYYSYSEFDGDYVIEIMTGARLPNLFNVVVKFEDVTLSFSNPFEFYLNKIVFVGENVRVIGEDIKFGECVMFKGDIINMNSLTLFSTIGIKKISTISPYESFLICTGNEISDSFNFKTSSINNSLFEYISSFFKNLNYKIFYFGITLDNKHSLKSLILNIINLNKYSVVITTGSVSKGKADIIPSILSELKVDIIFHTVSIKPGKPILFAKYSNVYFFCLPGNPISAIIGLRFFVYPFINYLNGIFFESPFFAILDSDYEIIVNIDLFLKSFVYFNKSSFYVKILDNQQSFKICSFVKSNAFVFLRKFDKIKKGDLIRVYFYNPCFLS